MITGTLTFSAFGKTMSVVLNRADPDKPVELLSNFMFGGYDANRSSFFNDPKLMELRSMLEDELEAFYAQAHRIQKKVQYLFKVKQNECKEVGIVRNKILEHPEKGVTHSFGYGTGGPVLSPIRQAESEFHDRGLIYNADAFDQYLAAIFDSAGVLQHAKCITRP